MQYYQDKPSTGFLQDKNINEIIQGIREGVKSANQCLSEKASYDIAAKSKENEVGIAL